MSGEFGSNEEIYIKEEDVTNNIAEIDQDFEMKEEILDDLQPEVINSNANEGWQEHLDKVLAECRKRKIINGINEGQVQQSEIPQILLPNGQVQNVKMMWADSGGIIVPAVAGIMLLGNRGLSMASIASSEMQLATSVPLAINWATSTLTTTPTITTGHAAVTTTITDNKPAQQYQHKQHQHQQQQQEENKKLRTIKPKPFVTWEQRLEPKPVNGYKHPTNCLCGHPGDCFDRMLECQQCKRWFHETCVGCLRYKLICGDRFYLYLCEFCNSGKEFLLRLPLNWENIAHLALWNLSNSKNSIKKHGKYFEYEEQIFPWVNTHWEFLQCPPELQSIPIRNRNEHILSALQKNSDKFQCEKEVLNMFSLWALKVSDPPSVLEITLPPERPITEASIHKFRYCERITESSQISRTFEEDDTKPDKLIYMKPHVGPPCVVDLVNEDANKVLSIIATAEGQSITMPIPCATALGQLNTVSIPTNLQNSTAINLQNSTAISNKLQKGGPQIVSASGLSQKIGLRKLGVKQTEAVDSPINKLSKKCLGCDDYTCFNCLAKKNGKVFIKDCKFSNIDVEKNKHSKGIQQQELLIETSMDEPIACTFTLDGTKPVKSKHSERLMTCVCRRRLNSHCNCRVHVRKVKYKHKGTHTCKLRLHKGSPNNLIKTKIVKDCLKLGVKKACFKWSQQLGYSISEGTALYWMREYLRQSKKAANDTNKVLKKKKKHQGNISAEITTEIAKDFIKLGAEDITYNEEKTSLDNCHSELHTSEKCLTSFNQKDDLSIQNWKKLETPDQFQLPEIVQEASMDDPITYTLTRGGTQMGRDKLSDSLGYTYYRKLVKNPNLVNWICAYREKRKDGYCNTRVLIRNGKYQRKGTHTCQVSWHNDRPNNLTKAEIAKDCVKLGVKQTRLKWSQQQGYSFSKSTAFSWMIKYQGRKKPYQNQSKEDQTSIDKFNSEKHICAICSKAFSLKDDLSIHMETHTSESLESNESSASKFFPLKHISKLKMSHESRQPELLQVAYTLTQGVTKRGKDKLSDSLGYNYYRKVERNPALVKWGCTGQKNKCKIRVLVNNHNGKYILRGTHTCQLRLNNIRPNNETKTETMAIDCVELGIKQARLKCSQELGYLTNESTQNNCMTTYSKQLKEDVTDSNKLIDKNKEHQGGSTAEITTKMAKGCIQLVSEDTAPNEEQTSISNCHSELHSCAICLIGFSLKDDLSIHMENHTGKGLESESLSAFNIMLPKNVSISQLETPDELQQPELVQEASMHDPITYTLTRGGTQMGKDKLSDSLGYTYLNKNHKTPNLVIWICACRVKKDGYCKSRVLVCNGEYQRKGKHICQLSWHNRLNNITKTTIAIDGSQLGVTKARLKWSQQLGYSISDSTLRFWMSKFLKQSKNAVGETDIVEASIDTDKKTDLETSDEFQQVLQKAFINEPIAYTITPGCTQMGGDKLSDSLGYTYYRKPVKNPNLVNWICAYRQRLKDGYCKARVLIRNEEYQRKGTHTCQLSWHNRLNNITKTKIAIDGSKLGVTKARLKWSQQLGYSFCDSTLRSWMSKFLKPSKKAGGETDKVAKEPNNHQGNISAEISTKRIEDCIKLGTENTAPIEEQTSLENNLTE